MTSANEGESNINTRKRKLENLLNTCDNWKRRREPMKWTGEDDECLLNAVENIGRNWKAIALEVGTKNDLQCRQRYEKVVKPGIRKGKWAIEEDEKLRYAMTLDLGSWIQVAELIPGRTSKQCRDRWNGHLDPTVSKNPFTSKEDELLLKLCIRFQRSWTKVAERMEGRTENMVRSRFIQIEQWLRKPSTNARANKLFRELNVSKLDLSELDMSQDKDEAEDEVTPRGLMDMNEAYLLQSDLSEVDITEQDITTLTLILQD